MSEILLDGQPPVSGLYAQALQRLRIKSTELPTLYFLTTVDDVHLIIVSKEEWNSGNIDILAPLRASERATHIEAKGEERR